jgi:transketolase
MRKQLIKTLGDIFERDERVVLLLGDIGVYGFKEMFKKYPNRIFNIGILEQASVGLAAGLAIEGMIPVFHTIAPFMIERALEQLKDDFGYQRLGGNFISVGGSYEYTKLGCTHHCPGDVQILKTIPGMEIIVPGHPEEFDAWFRRDYANGKPTYFRLNEHSNECAHESGIVKRGMRGVVYAIGPMLDRVVKACQDFNVTIIYRTKVEPFTPFWYPKTVVVEPFYEGTLAHDIGQKGPANVLSIGVPRKFLTNYGSVEEHDEEYGLTPDKLRIRIGEFLRL